MQVRFQEYKSGFHNFNNKVLLSIPLCSMLTTAVKHNTAIGRFLSMMEDHLDVHLHHNTLRKAFFHFSALTDYKYEFCCNRCGHHPPILIADANLKVAFDLPVNLLKRPPEDIQQTDLSVNIEKRWEDLEKELIAVGFCDGTKSKNPFTGKVSYSAFAPWIGALSRVGPVVPKTEVLKGFSRHLSDSDAKPKGSISEDTFLHLLESKKPQKSELVSACSELGVSSEGSVSDILNRLEELLLYKDIYPKMFIKLQKTGGGVLHASCMHSVVYYCSPLWWQESARDHTDGLLSFKIPPTIYISDVAGRVARHTNNRTAQQFFQPNDGRLSSATPENISKASQGKININFSWVKFLTQPGGPVLSTSTNPSLQSPHPVTQTADRFSLYDRLITDFTISHYTLCLHSSTETRSNGKGALPISGKKKRQKVKKRLLVVQKKMESKDTSSL
nr:HMG domain-containing protein 3-like [Paramormyrops kingsleyae]